MQRLAAAALSWAFLASAPLRAQVRAPSDGGTTVSLGQPRPWKWTLGAATGELFQRDDDQRAAEARLGVFRDLGNPIVGFAGLHVEGYAGVRDTRFDGGIRARLVSPFARFGVGADYNALDGRTRLLFSVLHPGRRGGLFHDGTVLRLDYVPARDHSVSLGIEKPIWRRVPSGKTRPPLDHVQLSGAVPPRVPAPSAALALEQPLAKAREAAGWIRRVSLPFLAHEANGRRAAEQAVVAELRELKRNLTSDGPSGDGPSRTLEGEVRRFHAEIERAFSIAIAGRALSAGEATAQGRAVAAQARSILLAEVLIPYDRLLGQVKKPDTIREFGIRARGIFLRWLHVNSEVPREAIDPMLWVFTSLIEIVETNRAAARENWRDSRFVWLPFQYALLPEEHDTQAELDALVERAVGERFTEGNFVSWVINEQFQYQLSRTIRQAEDYHVLWTHDFRGYDDKGDPDEMSYRHVLRSYLAALTERVRAYDRTGKFPVYIILLDEWFYQVRRGRLWMNVLEDPTGYRLRLPRGFAAWEDSIAAAQAALRAAIAASPLLQAKKAQYGPGWLRNLVKVHVNITNPADPTFWSWSVVPHLPLSDNMMRDHRKLVFYDITEEDPYRGEAIYTGAGVGEHYSSLSWEDRSLLVRGPVALGLKHAARNALLNQGIAAERIPHPLQPRARAPGYDAKIRMVTERNQMPLRALEIHNGTGFDAKQINVAKAVLYTLMPPGSVIKIPDSLWNSAFWGSAMLGCALRGVRVLVIAPSLANHPVQAFGSRVLGQELLWRLLAAERMLATEIAAAGGLLKIGVYASELQVTDIPGKLRAVRRTFAEHAWLRDLFGFPPSVYDGLGELATAVERLAMAPVAAPEFEYDPRSKLHLKANFFASREAWGLMARPEWAATTWEFVQQRIAQVQTRSTAVTRFEEYPDALIDVGGGIVKDWFASLAPRARERVVFYTVLGSQNQNYRSMVTDGEDAFVVANWPSIIPYLDLISMVGQSRWVEKPEDLDGLLPPAGWAKTRLSHWFKLAF